MRGTIGNVQKAGSSSELGIEVSWGSGTASPRKGCFSRALKDCGISELHVGRACRKHSLFRVLWLEDGTGEAAPGETKVGLIYPLSKCFIST